MWVKYWWITVGAHMACVVQDISVVIMHRALLGNGKIKHSMLWGIAFALCWVIVTNTILGDANAFFTVYSILFGTVFVILSAFLYGGDINRKVVSILVAGIMILLVDDIARYFFAMILGCTVKDINYNPAFLLTVSLLQLLTAGVIAALQRIWKTESAFTPKQTVTFCFFPVIAILLNMVLMTSESADKVKPLTFFTTVIIMVAMIVHLLLMRMFNTQIKLEQKAQIDAAIQQERADAIAESECAQRRITHDFQNHLTALQAYLQQGDMQGAKDYIADISDDFCVAAPVTNTNNALADAIFSRKYNKAQRQGVTVWFDLCDMRNFPLRHAEITAVFGNLLDNAIRAAGEAGTHEVKVRVRSDDDGWLISIKNDTKVDVVIPVGGFPQSSKDEPGHGIGLTNVSNTVKRYNGELILSCKNKKFCATVFLPNWVEETAQ